MSDDHTNQPADTPGPFYVLAECCLACGVPMATAPDLFGEDESGSCYIKRQPSTDAEFETALRVMWSQDLGCIRYRGRDLHVLRRLAEVGMKEHCDHPLAGVERVHRNIVTFTTTDGGRFVLGAEDFLVDFTNYMKSSSPGLTIRTTLIEGRGDHASFSLAWFEDDFHPIAVRFESRVNAWRIHHRGNLGLSGALDDWLRASGRFRDIRWFSEEAWEASGEWQPRPW